MNRPKRRPRLDASRHATGASGRHHWPDRTHDRRRISPGCCSAPVSCGWSEPGRPLPLEVIIARDSAALPAVVLPPARPEPRPNAEFLLLFGCFSLLYGTLLVPILAGRLPYDSEGATATFVIVFAIMTGFLGLTPLGTFAQSWLLFGLGLAVVLLGSLAFISPGTLSGVIDATLLVMLLGLGLVRLPLFWRQQRDGSRRLPQSYALPYTAMHLVCLLLGLRMLFEWPGWVNVPLLFALGASQFVLGYRDARPETTVAGDIAVDRAGQRAPLGRVRLPMASRLMLLLAVTMIFVAAISVLAVKGLLPFSGDRMSVLFVLITAFQVILLGETPIRSFVPSWPLAILGMALASAAMLAAIVPGLIDGPLAVFVGLSNLASGLAGFARVWGGVRAARSAPEGPVRRAVLRALAVSSSLYLLLVVFAVNLLLPDIIPGLVMLGVLTLTGALLAWLAVLIARTPHDAAALP